MAIARTGWDQAKTAGKHAVTGTLLGVVIGVLDRQAHHPILGHLFDQAVGTRSVDLPHGRICQDTDTARALDQGEHVDRVQCMLGYVGDPPVRDEPVERFLLYSNDSGLEHGLGDAGTSDEVIPRDLADAFEADPAEVDPRGFEPLTSWLPAKRSTS